MKTEDPATDVEGQRHGSTQRVSFQNNATVIEEGGDEQSEDDDASSSSPEPIPLHHSCRVRGYLTLFVSALFNYMAANEQLNWTHGDKLTAHLNLCISSLSINGNDVMGDPAQSPHRLRFSAAVSMITLLFTFGIILCHFDFCTPMRKNLWPKWFGQNGKVELYILIFFCIFWLLATWFTTSIRGPAGSGADQFNLYFSSWICCWACCWMLETWCTRSGRASFERFIRSWPNRCPLWILTFIMGLGCFLFALDAARHWPDATLLTPYVFKLYSDVSEGEWALLLVVTAATFITSFVWILAEIFRENRTNVDNLKSDVEIYIEGLSVHILTIVWIITICIVTMPGGPASLLGNLYFATWGTAFSVVGTLIWWIQEWRQGILNIIQEQQNEYDHAKKNILRREEEKLAKLSQDTKKTQGDDDLSEEAEEDDDGVLCEDVQVDDDITISITSGFGGNHPTSSSARSGTGAVSDATTPTESMIISATKSIFTSALSFIFSEEIDDDKGSPEADKSKGHQTDDKRSNKADEEL